MYETPLTRTKCPVKLADMLAAGVPVGAEAVGQVAEYVRDGRTGALCPSGDVGGLVVAAAELLAGEARRARWGADARADITARFDWESLATRLEPVYAG